MKNQEQKAFQKDLIISLILHLIFIGVFIYGLPSIFKKVQEEPDVITFEMLPVSDITNVRDQGVKTPEPKEIKKSQKIEKSASSPKENLEQKEETPKQEEQKPVEKKPKTQKEEDKKKPAPIKKEVKQPQAKKEETTKKASKKQEDVIDSLIANLEKESEGTERRSPNRTPPSPPNEGKFVKGNNADEDAPLSISEKMVIRKQIEDNWTQVAGNLKNIKVTLSIELDTKGVVTKAKIKNVICPLGSEQICSLVAETAERAAKKASPIKNLAPTRYDIWKKFYLDFYPSNM